jgi:hypothetical protein
VSLLSGRAWSWWFVRNRHRLALLRRYALRKTFLKLPIFKTETKGIIVQRGLGGQELQALSRAVDTPVQLVWTDHIRLETRLFVCRCG